MKIYHGSKITIEHPRLKGSDPRNDYGPAFYMTLDLESAHEWACRNDAIGIVNQYDFNMDGLKILDLREYSVLNWLAILMHYRELEKSFINAFSYRLKVLDDKYYIDVEQYDVVIGYRADDAYFRYPLDFIRGNITLEQLEQSFKMGDLGVQHVLISEKAINKLRFVKSFHSEEKYLGKYFNRVLEATRSFNNLDKDSDGTRIQDIIRQQK